MKYKDSISQAMVEAMAADPKVVLLGQNLTAPHGGFGTTTEAFRRFPERVLEIPVSETMITGACVGLAMEGYKPILVHCRADFSLFSFEHLINTAAKIPFLHGKPLPFVMRVVVGRGWGQGPVHSQSFHHMLAQVPGLRVIAPVTPSSYGGLLGDALRTGQPTIIFESRRLYDQGRENPNDDWFISSDLSIVAVGDTFLDALEARDRLKNIRVLANVIPWVDLGEKPVGKEPNLYVDMAPRRPEPGVVAPPFRLQGVSQVFERSWYLTADDIVEAACKVLGVESPKREQRHEDLSPAIRSAF